MTRTRFGVALLLGAGALFVSATEAHAQDVSGSATATTPVSIAPTTTVRDEAPDHDKVVGHFAVGYFGINNLPIGQPAGGGVATGTVPTPIIGARYWLTRGIGIDAGIGFSTLSGSTEVSNGMTSTSTNHPSQLGFALHGGVPLALAAGHHFTFELVPELNLGFTNGTIKAVAPNTPDDNLSGFLFSVGARIGGEIQFGFIGIPELALEGSVGAYLQRQSVKSSIDPASASDGSWSFGTTVGSNPWALFTNNISALYYF